MEQKNKFIKENYEDYASGRVLYGVTGATNFSVRISSEVFELCTAYLASQGNTGPYTVYDPFCGTAYSLTVLGFLHSPQIKTILASDIDPTILEFAVKNLSLLTEKGIDNRIRELQKFIKEFGKESHRQALESALKLKAKVPLLKHLNIKSFECNILGDSKFPKEVAKVDLVIADVPYGQMTSWKGLNNKGNPIEMFLGNIKGVLSPTAIIAVILDKKQIVSYEGYERIKVLTRGKRKILLLKKAR